MYCIIVVSSACQNEYKRDNIIINVPKINTSRLWLCSQNIS